MRSLAHTSVAPERGRTAARAATRATHMPDRRSELAVTALLVWLPLLAILALAVLITANTDITMRQMTQDPTTVLDGPFYVGAISNLGNVLWAAAVALCLFAASGLPGIVGPGWSRFLLVSGAFTALLLVDDMLLVHDEILPRYAGIGGDAYGVLYVAGMLGFLVGFRARIRQTNWQVLIVALALFGISTVVDVGSSRLSDLIPSSVVILLEDAAKLLGIGTWLAYLASVARQGIVAAMQEDQAAS
ncbi:MAG TPA: hypothetical protein VFP30_00735 [Candidatus Limnocylindria bacterium]|nr:hypothetical protein [Candidatus Limnocylindria bacterium]